MDAVKTGALIAQARKEKGLTQRELAEKVYVSVQAVSKWELGKNFPDLALMEPLAEALGLTVTELLAGERGEQPHDKLVRDSLRLGEEQLRPKIRRWKWLFILAAALLLAVALGFGYVWVRDNTEWLPQRETVVSPVDVTSRENIMMKVLGGKGQELYLYDIALADDLLALAIQAELWVGGQLEESWLLQGEYFYDLGMGREEFAYWDLLPAGKASISPPDHEPRRRTLALALDPEYNGNFGETGSLDYTLCFADATGISTRPGTIEEIPHMTGGMLGVHPLEEKTAVDPEEGVVLLAWGLQGLDHGWHQWGSSHVEDSAFLVFKLYCKS